ncbi:hypothetical protein KR044_001156, partial [Drosophila immigrans]
FATTRGNRIVGGQDAEEGAAPYQVSIQTAWRSNICGGVILSRRWVVTAGHCALDFNLEDLRIVVGTNERLVPGQLLYPDQAIVHSMYDIPAVYANDIGLFHLNDSIVFNERTKPVELSTEYPPVGATVTLTGWGAPELNWPAMERLQTIDLTVMDHAACKAAWDGSDGVDVGHICTFTKAGEGSCNGDSGGPLMWQNKLVGVVNWGAPCAVGKPDMHANIVYYTEWIQWQKPNASYFVEEHYVHCNYNYPDYHNDIALIRLNDSIVWNEVTQPIDLPTAPPVNGSHLLLTGWGSTYFGSDTPDVLQQASLTYVDYKTCQEVMGGDPFNGYGHICTLTDEGQGACHGDSGGPVVADRVLYGLVNWGYPCAVGYPDSYASTYFYRDWIQRTMSQ